jgi:hypothetical protein
MSKQVLNTRILKNYNYTKISLDNYDGLADPKESMHS